MDAGRAHGGTLRPGQAATLHALACIIVQRVAPAGKRVCVPGPAHEGPG